MINLFQSAEQEMSMLTDSVQRLEDKNHELHDNVVKLKDALIIAESDLENMNFQHLLQEKTIRRNFLSRNYVFVLVICFAILAFLL